ncbi:MAG: phosphoserine phosphatase SerB [Pseudomonadota bacterium]
MSDLIIGGSPAWLNQPPMPLAFVATICSSDVIELQKAAEWLEIRDWQNEREHSNTREYRRVCPPAEAWECFQGFRSAFFFMDALLQPESERNHKLLICDMDMTMVDSETLDDVAALAGIGDQIAEITRRAMHGEIDFDGALRERIRMLQGQPIEWFERIGREVALNPGAEELINTCRGRGIHTILISGGFEQVVEQVASRLGFDEFYCNHLQVEEGLLNGVVFDPIVDAEFKRTLLQTRAQALGLPMSQCCAIGDGANDRLMIEAAGLGIAFHAKPILRSATCAQINYGGLDRAARYLGL